jgi:NAD(P)H dehydrogenase (quinone)
MRNKVGATCVTVASISNGKETTMQSILAVMLINQMIVGSGGGAFGAIATTGPESPGIDEKKLDSARALGKKGRGGCGYNYARLKNIDSRRSGQELRVNGGQMVLGRG